MKEKLAKVVCCSRGEDRFEDVNGAPRVYRDSGFVSISFGPFWKYTGKEAAAG